MRRQRKYVKYEEVAINQTRKFLGIAIKRDPERIKLKYTPTKKYWHSDRMKADHNIKK